MVVDLSQPNFNNLEHELFDVDLRTGFMPSRPPLGRLPAPWAIWEDLLDGARSESLQPGDKLYISSAEMARSEQWRVRVRQIKLLPVHDLETSIEHLRRAHLVLTFVMHFYVQTLPPNSSIVIPRPIAIPLLQVAKILDLPPVITFSDTVLYNWYLDSPSENGIHELPTTNNHIKCQTLFTNTPDESAFYLCSARIELHGARALSIMRSTTNEIAVGDFLAIPRLTAYLNSLSTTIDELKALLMEVREECDPDIYYNIVRPWFRGEDSDTYLDPGSGKKRKWIFEGAGDYTDLNMLPPDRELSGASAGQSSLIHALDVFLGVNHEQQNGPSFMKRMQRYMPRQHRRFLDHLGKNPRPLREFVMSVSSGEPNDGAVALKEAYNRAVMSLKAFRDSHMIIAALYIIGPARRAAEGAAKAANRTAFDDSQKPLEVSVVADTAVTGITGTGGTSLVQFLKDVRSRTIDTVLHEEIGM
ncbi:Indoleamine 2,3-dioxygenase [Lentinula raphanica]|uniref:Indoleamine 2,3-dioxygenase n=1 Tax=Lentinula raphanica TaxID=153919 RepID=A0AA38P9R9_9AGAR|nr:Indoleamine 2,3-dioxygenase [Lentinula raphanica]